VCVQYTHQRFVPYRRERERESGSGSFYSSYGHSYYTLSAHNVNSFLYSLLGCDHVTASILSPSPLWPSLSLSIPRLFVVLFLLHTLFARVCLSLNHCINEQRSFVSPTTTAHPTDVVTKQTNKMRSRVDGRVSLS
jgi:hypothetical protein